VLTVDVSVDKVTHKWHTVNWQLAQRFVRALGECNRLSHVAKLFHARYSQAL